MLLQCDKNGRPIDLDGGKPELKYRFIAKTLHSFCLSHPCLGARSASGSGGLFISVQDEMAGVFSAFHFLNDLERYYYVSDSLPATEKSLAIVFTSEPTPTQDHFAERYWAFVQILHDLDALRDRLIYRFGFAAFGSRAV